MFNWIDLNALQLLTSSVCVFAYKCENVGALTTRCGHIRSEYMINAIMRQQPKWIPNIFKCWQLIHLTVPSLSAAKELAIRSVLVAHFIHEFGFVGNSGEKQSDLIYFDWNLVIEKSLNQKRADFLFVNLPFGEQVHMGTMSSKFLNQKPVFSPSFFFF